MTGNEETDCALLKARLVDDLFQWLLMALEDEGKLEDTVIIGVTDHYTYGYKDMESLYDLSGTEEDLLLEKTPCFIWSADMEAMDVEKTLNTSDPPGNAAGHPGQCQLLRLPGLRAGLKASDQCGNQAGPGPDRLL